MERFVPRDPNYQKRVVDSIKRQPFMMLIGAELTHLGPGQAEISVPFDLKLTQQDGFLHAGVVTTLLDMAGGYAAHSLMPANSGLLSVEFKVNLMRPAVGERFVARGQVLKPGKRLTVCESRLYACQGDEETLVAALQGTMYCVDRGPEAGGHGDG